MKKGTVFICVLGVKLNSTLIWDGSGDFELLIKLEHLSVMSCRICGTNLRDLSYSI
jgi:hypothetical protein